MDNPNLEQEDSLICAINVTPFVDVMLVLLVIFMVTAPALMREGIEIDLPKISKSVQSKESKEIPLEITINKNGELSVNKKSVALQDLKSYVEELKSKHTQALISADSGTLHGKVVEVIEKVQLAGIEQFSIQIEKD